MTEMGLDLDEVAEFGALAWAFSDEKSMKGYEKFAESESVWHRKVYQVAKRASEMKLPQRGIWHDSEQNEWEYYLHGGGCKLTNVETGEPINWDAPNVNSFTQMFFERHLLWQVSYPYRSIKLGYLCSVMLQPVRLLMKEVEGENFSL